MYPVLATQGNELYISASFVSYGACYVVAALLLGHIYDAFGWRVSIAIHFIDMMLALSLVFVQWHLADINEISFVSRVVVWQVIGGLFGISDASFNMIINVSPPPISFSVIFCLSV